MPQRYTCQNHVQTGVGMFSQSKKLTVIREHIYYFTILLKYKERKLIFSPSNIVFWINLACVSQSAV